MNKASGDGLPPLREVIAAHHLAAKKSLGQNFLFDLNLTARIARAAGPLEDATVIEIGPGPGGLTRALLAMGARHVIAVERDERALPALEEIAQRYPGRLEVVCADAQDFDPRPWLGSTRAKIVANLPYNIATALLLDWLSIEPWPPWYDMMVLMFQREVAERIVARENEEAYGRLGVLANWRAETKILFDISPAAFVPQPKVTSSVVRLVPRAAPESCDRRALEQVAAAAFNQRRKMLRNAVQTLPPALRLEPDVWEEVFRASGIDGRVRGEHVGGGDHVGAGRAGHGGGVVGGVGVHDDQLVDQRHPAHPALVQVGDQAAHGGRLVPRGEDHADPVPASALGPQQRVEIQLRQGGGGRRPVLEPGAGVGSHRLTVDQDSGTSQDHVGKRL